MKKIFLLSVLFIFMNNISAAPPYTPYKYVSKSGMIEVIDQYTFQASMINVYCIADAVFVQDGDAALTQIMDYAIPNSLGIIPLTCARYKKKMKKPQTK